MRSSHGCAWQKLLASYWLRARDEWEKKTENVNQMFCYDDDSTVNSSPVQNLSIWKMFQTNTHTQTTTWTANRTARLRFLNKLPDMLNANGNLIWKKYRTKKEELIKPKKQQHQFHLRKRQNNVFNSGNIYSTDTHIVDDRNKKQRETGEEELFNSSRKPKPVEKNSAQRIRM